MVDNHTLKQVAGRLAEAGLVAVSSGAGVSKESGVPTFRDAQDGLWKRYDAVELASPQAFQRNPALVWEWYMYRYDLVNAVEPNRGHYAIAELESLLNQVVVLTQNVDGLHTEAGSTDVVELHGNIKKFKCFDNCLGGPTFVEITSEERSADEPPVCPKCGFGLVRPAVVWFGEVLPKTALERAFDIASACDVMLVVGTSGIVQPAASLPVQAKRSGAYVIEVNPSESLITRHTDVFLQGPSGAILPSLVTQVRALVS